MQGDGLEKAGITRRCRNMPRKGERGFIVGRVEEKDMQVKKKKRGTLFLRWDNWITGNRGSSLGSTNDSRIPEISRKQASR